MLNRNTWIAAPLVFSSGWCALIYQVVWTRELRLVFGASTASSSAVIAIFIAGLGFGGLWFGRRVERSATPLSFYARLEFAIALASALTPLLLELVRALYVLSGGSLKLGMLGSSAVRLVLTTLVLGPATFFMGGTLPALARAVETDSDKGRSGAAWMYGINTLGAVLGATLSTFVMLEHLGSRGTLYIAAALNVVVATTALLLSRKLEPAAAAGQRLDESTAPPAAEDVQPAGPRRLIFASAALVGFAFFLMELVWYRVLTPLLGGSIFTFGLILAVALAGIGLGSALYAAWLSRRRATLLGFALSCSLEALCIALPFALGDRIALSALLLRPLGAFGFSGFLAGWTAITLVVVFPAALVSGAQFPMLISLLGSGRSRVARDVGAAYAANTVGAIVGALSGGFGALPALGALGCWRLVCGLLAGWSVLIVLVAIARQSPRLHSAWVFGLSALTVAAILAQGPTAAWRHAPIGAGRVQLQEVTSLNGIQRFLNEHRRITDWEVDGIESTIGITNADGVSFLVNGKSDGSVRGDASTQVMGGLLGAALVPKVKRALVIGLGTGSSAGWLARVPEIERVDVAEIEPAILTVAKRCELVNEFALNNPKLRIHRGDARELLSLLHERYEVIFSEPSNPYRAGVASLYTREFYAAAKAHLAKHGVFVQWLQVYDVGPDTIRSVYATMNTIFPHVETWFGLHDDLFLVASQHAPKYDTAALRARVAQEPFVRAMRITWQTDNLEGFLAHYLANPAVARAVGYHGVPINTDDRSPVEFGFARGVLGSQESARALLSNAGQDRPALTGPDVNWDRVEYERQAFAFVETAGVPPNGQVAPVYRRRFELLVHWSAGDFPGAMNIWNSLDETERSNEFMLIERHALAEVIAYRGEDVQEPWVTSLVSEQPTFALALRATWLFRHGKRKEATEWMVKALHQYRIDPWPLFGAMQRALRNLQMTGPSDRELVPLWLEALSKPYAAYVNEAVRQVTRLSIARSLGPTDPTCIGVFESMEPNPIWTEEVLDFRATCYQKQNHPLQAKAEADRALFRSNAK